MRMSNAFEEWPCFHPETSPTAISASSGRFKFLFNGYAVPCNFVKSEKSSSRLLVTLNGAVKREADKDPREIFQRRTWSDEFESNVLMISDATLHPSNNIQIGWAQGNGTDALISGMAKSVEFVRDSLGARNEEIVFFGSSAGGFQAVALHSWFPGSRFLVNNAQFDWTLYHPTHSKRIAAHSYGGLDIRHVRKLYPNMCNVFSRFVNDRIPIAGRYLVNVASPADFGKQLPVLTSFMSARAKLQPSIGMDISVGYYADPKAGHMPLNRKATLREVASLLEGVSVEGASVD